MFTVCVNVGCPKGDECLRSELRKQNENRKDSYVSNAMFDFTYLPNNVFFCEYYIPKKFVKVNHH